MALFTHMNLFFLPHVSKYSISLKMAENPRPDPFSLSGVQRGGKPLCGGRGAHKRRLLSRGERRYGCQHTIMLTPIPPSSQYWEISPFVEKRKGG